MLIADRVPPVYGEPPAPRETFAARQRRLQGEQKQNVANIDVTKQNPTYQPQSQLPAGGDRNLASALGSPARSAGQPQPPPLAPASPQPQAATAAPAPAPPTPVTGNGKIPPPLPQQPAFSSGASAPLQAAQVPQAPVARYTPTTFNTQNPQLGALPDAYGGTQMAQFAGPDQSALSAGQQALGQRILASPETLSPTVVGQLKEQQKEAELLAQQQILQALKQNAAARGVTNGATLGGREADVMGDSLGRIISGNRDIDIAAAQTNRQDQLQALSAIEGLLSGQLGRASTGFQNTLAGQSAQAADSRTAAQDALSRAIMGNDAARQAADFDLRQQAMAAEDRFRGYQSDRSADDAALQRVMAQFGINESVANNQLQQRDANRSDAAFGLQRDLGLGGMELDRSRLGEQTRQFDASNGLNILQFLEQQRQYNNNLGFNYNQLGQQGQDALIRQVMGLLG